MFTGLYTNVRDTSPAMAEIHGIDADVYDVGELMKAEFEHVGETVKARVA